MNRAVLAELVIALVGIGLGIFFLFAFEIGAGVPDRSRLEPVKGQIAWVQGHRYGVRFSLDSDPRSFDYSSKANALGLVEDSLRSAGSNDVIILINPINKNGPIYSERKYLGVWHIRVGDKPVRTFHDIATAWREDDEIGKWLGGAFILAGLFLGVSVPRKRNAPQQGVPASEPRC